VTVSILQTLAVLPSGDEGAPLTFDELGRYLGAQCNTVDEKDRNNRHVLRDEMYRDGGVAYIEGVIDETFTDLDVRRLRKHWVKHARFSNPLKRIVNELSTVYAEPAKRVVDGDENNAKYQALLERLSANENMLQISRLLNLHRALLVRFRMRDTPGADEREPVLDHATPASVRAVLHPNDPTMVVGWLIRASYRPVRDQLNIPAWTLWTDHERIHLRDDFNVITESHLEHGLGLNPWVPISLSPPGAGFWPGEEGEDLTAAATARWIAGVFLLKETKSATKQTILQGDGTSMARGQGADSEIPIELADGQNAMTVDMSMDLEMFQRTADHIMEQVAQNYGMSAALINQQGVQSAEARELMRVPLRELRMHQQVPLRRFERQLARVMVAVLKKDEPSLAFDDTGWRIEFGEAQTPLSPMNALDLFLKARSAGTDNTVAYIKRSHPGMTDEQALDEMENNIKVETARNVLMRPLMQISGALGAEQPSDEDESPNSPVAETDDPDSTQPPTGDRRRQAQES
jgi:hypothetical protein